MENGNDNLIKLLISLKKTYLWTKGGFSIRGQIHAQDRFYLLIQFNQIPLLIIFMLFRSVRSCFWEDKLCMMGIEVPERRTLITSLITQTSNILGNRESKSLLTYNLEFEESFQFIKEVQGMADKGDRVISSAAGTGAAQERDKFSTSPSQRFTSLLCTQ